MKGILGHIVALASLALAACTPSTPAPAVDPPVIRDASDAAALLDAGPHPSACALACASWAAAKCVEATGDCVGVCEHARAYGEDFYPMDLLTCVIDAGGDKARMQPCSPPVCR